MHTQGPHECLVGTKGHRTVEKITREDQPSVPRGPVAGAVASDHWKLGLRLSVGSLGLQAYGATEDLARDMHF